MELKLTSFMISWFLRMLIRWFVYYAYGKLNGVKVFVSLNIKITTLLYVSVAWLRKYMCYFLRGLHIYYKHRRISNAFRWWPARNSGFNIKVLNLFPFFHLRSLSYHNAIITICIKILSSFLIQFYVYIIPGFHWWHDRKLYSKLSFTSGCNPKKVFLLPMFHFIFYLIVFFFMFCLLLENHFNYLYFKLTKQIHKLF